MVVWEVRGYLQAKAVPFEDVLLKVSHAFALAENMKVISRACVCVCCTDRIIIKVVSPKFRSGVLFASGGCCSVAMKGASDTVPEKAPQLFCEKPKVITIQATP